MIVVVEFCKKTQLGFDELTLVYKRKCIVISSICHFNIVVSQN